MKQFFKNMFQSDPSQRNDNGKLSKKTSYLIVIGLLGLFVLIVGNIFSGGSEKGPSSNDKAISPPKEKTDGEFAKTNSEPLGVSELEQSYEQDLMDLLEKIDGVTDVQVMVNLDSTDVKVYEKNLVTGQQTNQEEDTNGGTRVVEDKTEETETVIVREGDQEAPLLVQTKKPEVRGVLVVAKGVDHATIEQWVVNSVSSVLDMPTHRVSVMPKQ